MAKLRLTLEGGFFSLNSSSPDTATEETQLISPTSLNTKRYKGALRILDHRRDEAALGQNRVGKHQPIPYDLS